MTEQEIYRETKEFVKKIKATDLFQEYVDALRELEKDPNLYQSVHEYRMKNYEMQLSVSEEDIMRETENFERQYEWLRSNQVADRFLSAELAFCRMMQDVSAIIDDEIQVEEV